MRKRLLRGWRPEADLRPLRLMTLILLAVGSFVTAILAFRVLGELSQGVSSLLWAGLCICPPLGIAAWVLDEQRHWQQAAPGAASDPRQEEEGASPQRDGEPTQARLRISRDVA